MFSCKEPSAPTPASHPHSIVSKGGRSRSIPSTNTAVLPTGECRFILLHPSISDQRCCCQGFRRNENLPGANCECGHQACYHVPGNTNIPAPTADPVTTTTTTTTQISQAPMMEERLRRLEEQHQQERKIWEDALKAEKRARREEARNLREAMHSFYKFMEQEVPRKFVEVEDKIDGIMDREYRLRERVMSIDDSSMALENRIADLENEEDDGQSRYSDDSDDSRERKRRKSVEVTPLMSIASGSVDTNVDIDQEREARHRIASSAPSLASPRLRSPNSLLVPSSSSRSSTPPSVESSSPPGDRNPASDFASAFECLDAPAPIPGAHTRVRVLTSPQYDLIAPLDEEVTFVKHPSSLPDSYTRDEGHIPADVRTNHDQSSGNQDSSMSSLIRSVSSTSLPRTKHDIKKRKRDATLYQARGVGVGLKLTLPLPPPLSLS